MIVAARALDVPWPSPIPQPRTLRPQLGRQVPVVADLIQRRKHRRVDRAVGHRMFVELADRGQQMVDPTRAPHPAPPGAAPLRWSVTPPRSSFTTPVRYRDLAVNPSRRSIPLE